MQIQNELSPKRAKEKLSELDKEFLKTFKGYHYSHKNNVIGVLFVLIPISLVPFIIGILCWESIQFPTLTKIFWSLYFLGAFVYMGYHLFFALDTKITLNRIQKEFTEKQRADIALYYYLGYMKRKDLDHILEQYGFFQSIYSAAKEKGEFEFIKSFLHEGQLIWKHAWTVYVGDDRKKGFMDQTINVPYYMKDCIKKTKKDFSFVKIKKDGSFRIYLNDTDWNEYKSWN